jgi:hypothetical protein
MGRPVASIQTEITALEAQIATSSQALSVGSNGSSYTSQPLAAMQVRLDKLYAQLGRANGTNPMFPRGTITGLR